MTRPRRAGYVLITATGLVGLALMSASAPPAPVRPVPPARHTADTVVDADYLINHSWNRPYGFRGR
jgi:hypothetical protein